MEEIQGQEKAEERPLPTIWEVSDDLWERIEPVLRECDPPKATGRKRVSARRVLDALIFRLRSGCQWNRFPSSLPDDSTVHRTMQHWIDAGVFPRLWALLIEECEELGGVQWEWQSADGSMAKARLGGITSARTRPTGGRPASSGASCATPTEGRCRS